jgi:hypothetical protein
VNVFVREDELPPVFSLLTERGVELDPRVHTWDDLVERFAQATR